MPSASSNNSAERLIAPDFCPRHHRRATDFTRDRVLTFPVLMLLLLQKSLKSLQAHLHEFLGQMAGGVHAPGLSGGALTHARAKLRAFAFAELNQTVLATVYGTEHAALVQRWQGHRLLSVDSSLVRLPASEALGQTFGWVQLRQPSRFAGTPPAGARLRALRRAQSNRAGSASGRLDRGRDHASPPTPGPRPTRRLAP